MRQRLAVAGVEIERLAVAHGCPRAVAAGIADQAEEIERFGGRAVIAKIGLAALGGLLEPPEIRQSAYLIDAHRLLGRTRAGVRNGAECRTDEVPHLRRRPDQR